MYHPFSISAWSVTSTTRPETTLLGPVPLARVHRTGFRGGAWLDPRTETSSKGRRSRITFNIHRMFQLIRTGLAFASSNSNLSRDRVELHTENKPSEPRTGYRKYSDSWG